jgi:hypothetical protein
MLTPIGDHAAFAGAVSHLLERPDERARLAAGAASRIVTHHDERRGGTRAGGLARAAAMNVPFAILRHAPTGWNAEGRLQGLTDIPLSLGG